MSLREILGEVHAESRRRGEFAFECSAPPRLRVRNGMHGGVE